MLGLPWDHALVPGIPRNLLRTRCGLRRAPPALLPPPLLHVHNDGANDRLHGLADGIMHTCPVLQLDSPLHARHQGVDAFSRARQPQRRLAPLAFFLTQLSLPRTILLLQLTEAFSFLLLEEALSFGFLVLQELAFLALQGEDLGLELGFERPRLGLFGRGRFALRGGFLFRCGSWRGRGGGGSDGASGGRSRSVDLG